MSRVSRVLTALAVLVVLAGCPKPKPPPPSGDDAGTTPQPPAPTLALLSSPARSALAGQAWTYRPLAQASTGDAVAWTLTQGPTGAELSDGATVRWTPAAGQVGPQTFTLHAAAGALAADQTFAVEVAALTTLASASVSPSTPLAAAITVDAPLSPVRGSGVVVPPGALAGSAPVDLSVSAVDHAPVPQAAGRAGVAASDVKVVDFGPSGLTFQQPVTIYVPVSDAVLAAGDVELQTFDFAAGGWVKVPVRSVDRANKVVAADVTHFSVYATVPSVPTFALAASSGGTGTSCANAVMAKAPLAWPLSSIPASAVGGYVGSGSTVSDVIAGMTAGQALQVTTQLIVAHADGSGATPAIFATVAARKADGSFTVSAWTSQGPATLTAPPSVAGGDLAPWLDGSRLDVVVPQVDATRGATVTAWASLALLPAASALPGLVPPTAGLVGQKETLTVAALAPPAAAAADSDCDGVPDAYDPTPNGAPPLALAPSPAGPTSVTAGATATLSVAPPAGTTVTWSSAPAGLTVTPAAGGSSATVTGATPGAFVVTASATGSAGSGQASFSVTVLPASATTLPPKVSISAGAGNVVHVGDTVVLTALGVDPQGAPLTYAWATSFPLAVSGNTASFTASAIGDVAVSVTASNGPQQSAPASLVITALAASANRPPSVPSVTPLSKTVSRVGGSATVTFTASAVDPDGDAVSYRFAPDPLSPTGAKLSVTGGVGTFQAFSDGAYVVLVSAVDTKGAESAPTLVKVLVAPPPPASPVDADHDGYPAGVDCDDTRATVYPGAPEICGDGIDQNCDGHDTELLDCDADGDHSTPRQGDCDDHNPARNPAQTEFCDGVDNNCNGQVDEGFAVGAACTAGVGACAATGTVSCSATRTSTTCGAVPGTAKPEVCNGVDDDCNGAVDDVSPSATGSTNACGSCGVVCSAGPNATATCTAGGCGQTCAPGFVDLDKVASNGCECHVTGPEVCDGLDNDCNGLVDEGLDAIFYNGPAGTAGVGQCAPGATACISGKTTVTRTDREPAPEICDGLDNDCNGLTDEGYSLTSDTSNCGACGRICGVGQSCASGQCTGGSGGADGGIVCPAPMGTCATPAGPTCVKLDSDSSNCGACGRVCAPGIACAGGACQTPVADGGSGGGSGGSDAGTAGGGAMDGGVSCAPTLKACVGPQGPACVDLQSSSSNCGGCNLACGAGTACFGGTCKPTGGGTGGSDGGTPACGALGQVCCAGGACASGSCVGGVCQPVSSGDGGFTCPTPGLVCGTPAGVFCVDPMKDSANCGACGKVCPSGSACVGGACAPSVTCAGSQIACGASCVTPATDNANCGACGYACQTGWRCTTGACLMRTDAGTSMSCPAATTECGPAGATSCVSVWSDSANCGACGSACGPGTGCFGGFCKPTGTGGGSDGGAMGCGNPGQPCCATGCNAGLVCGNGVCQSAPSGDGGAPACGAPLLACGPLCVDPRVDSNNCGGCGKVCGPGMACASGMCQPASSGDGGTGPCGAPGQPCCGASCSAGLFCGGGVCQPLSSGDGGAPACGAPLMACGPLCVDPRVDANNCGGCGKVCGPGTACASGMCQPASSGDGGTASCAPPTMLCPTPAGAACVNVTSSTQSCGSCGYACPGGFACTAGFCAPATDGGAGVSCPPSSTVCPGAAGNACVNTQGDSANCGACGVSCGAGAACFGGFCKPTGTGGSDGGTTACGNPGQPCCATGCNAGLVCGGGVCQSAPSGDGGAPACGAPLMACGAACVDPRVDSNNCGGCGKVCGPGTACASGMCQPVSTGDGGSGSCGAPGQPCCGASCGAGLVCGGGLCQTAPTTDGGTACVMGQSRSCYTGPAGTQGVGACHSGSQSCMPNGQWDLMCGAQVVPTAEVCGNGIDDNCNGLVDEGCPVAVLPALIHIVPGDTFAFMASGGTAPYRFALNQAPSGGLVTSAGLYTAGLDAGLDRLTASDADGGSAQATIDVAAPPPVLLTPSGGIFNMLPQVSVATAVHCTLSATWDGQPLPAPALTNGMGTLVAIPPMQGTHALVATATCPGARTGSTTATYVIDQTPPLAPTLTSPDAGAALSGGVIAVAGLSEPGALVDVLEQPSSGKASVTAGDGGAFAAQLLNVATGQHLVSAQATDLAGNRGPPSAGTLVLVTGGAAAPLGAWSPSGTTVQAGRPLQLYGVGGTPPYAWALTSGTAGGTVTPGGVYVCMGDGGVDQLRLSDSADAGVSTSVTVVAPLPVSILQPLPGALVPPGPMTVVVQTAPSASVSLQIDATSGGGGLADPTGHFQFNAPTPAAGAHTLTATATAGVASGSASVSFRVCTPQADGGCI